MFSWDGFRSWKGALRFIRQQRKAKVLSTNAVEPMTRAFVQSIEQFVKDHQIPLGCRGTAGEVSAARRGSFRRQGAGEVHHLSFREATQPEKEQQLHLDRQIPALVNHYYFYCIDEDFGPFFLKLCSYFPNAKLCLNGHEYAKRQLQREKIA